ncbi:unnamed protein product [Owenia fusiformis]|uniref:Cytochrome P450 n=1 Tax=Owenia fusiformis TaxID=6347 RepID=A0A8S4Q933_OWEFU|nr:unnamed protein product [Owenia fusiformis]
MLYEFLLASTVLCLTYNIYKYMVKKTIKLPGPRGLPIIGNIHSFILGGGPVWQVQKWAKEYGDAFKISILGAEIVILSDYDSIYDALVVRSNDFAGRPFDKSYGVKEWFNSNIATNDFTPTFRTYKKLGLRGLKQHGDGISRIVNISNENISQTVKEFKEENGEPFQPHMKLQNLLCRIIVCMLLGENTPYEENDGEFARRWLDDLEVATNGPFFYLLEMFPVTRFFGNPVYPKMTELMECRDKHFTEWIERFKLHKQESGERTLIDELLIAKDEGTITDDGIFGIMTDTFSAGVFTTFTTTSGFLLAMTNYPDIQNNLHKEIDCVIGKEQLPELSDREKMPYMEATILETLRYMSIVATNVPHKTTCDTHIAGCDIPKGTQVWMNLYGMHHDKRYFKHNPDSFDPTRFLESDGNLVPHEERKALLAFGAGRRVCMGEVLAKTRMFLLFTQLLQNFHFEHADPKNPVLFDMRKFITSPTLLLTPKFKIVAKPR